MAPRPPESMHEVVRRIREGAAHLSTQPVRFGAPHHSHAVVKEEGRYRVRQLVLSRARADAFLKQHGRFMPENAEDLSEPTGAIEHDFATLDELINALLAK
jgi:hypothetical protein